MHARRVDPDALELWAVTEAGPVRLATPPAATGLGDVLGAVDPGVYTGLRTYGGDRFLRLEDHLDRTEASAAALGLGDVLDRRAARRALGEIAGAHEGCDLKLRLDVLPEPARALGTESRVLVAAVPRRPVPADVLERGARVHVAPALTRTAPLVKESAFIEHRRPYPLGTIDAYEHLLLDGDGRILEGSTSNVFLVRGGEVWTAGEGVLEGITRRIVLEICAELRVTVRLEAVHIDDVPRLDEAFLSSSSRHLVPVVEIAGQPVGSGAPGPLTRQLTDAFDAYAERQARPAQPT